jgi:hypothetical protein
MRVGLPTLLLVAAALPVRSQVTVTMPDPYAPGRPPGQQPPADYGPSRVVELDHLVFAPESYQRSNVIVQGRLAPAVTPEYLNLTEGGSATVLLIPGHGIAVAELQRLLGARVEVQGIVRLLRKKVYVRGVDLDLIEDPGLPVLPEASSMLPRLSITALSLDERESRDTRKAETAGAMVHEIREDPARYAGKKVTIRGQFRGRNLFGDLPAGSQRSREDWVLKDGAQALWVMGKAPRGKGFSLDLDYRGDAVRWLEVAGRAEVANGIVYLRASKVALASPPALEAEEAPN